MTRDSLTGHRLDDDGVREVLRDVGFGVLALTHDDRPYPIPLSFGFADDRCYVIFVAESAAGRKLTYATNAERGALVAYEVSDDAWRSALVEGPFRRARGKEEWDHGRAALADNAWRPALFGEAGGSHDESRRMWVLEAAEMGGRLVE
jgi:nitroimidazol reductase NimA-like FMN-containing flavoprotein (pyridoxamine 5'-phosphate oxidase superfamily)